MNRTRSKELYQRAQKVMPGGVNSPVRAFGSVHQLPIIVDHAYDARIVDVDQNEFIDYISSWGPLVFGHSDPEIYKAFEQALKKGITYGVPSKVEVEMAEKIIDAYPACEMIRMVNSGTEATMSAIRVARGYTGRKKIVKFEGCYHGHSDQLLVKSGSGTLTFQSPTSLGVPQAVIDDTLVLPYNDESALVECLADHREEIACVIIEPVAGNMGVVVPKQEFLKTLREKTAEYGMVLIFDEVITGFRLAYGGAAEVFGIQPDMACFGKIIGGGLPVGAYGGRKELMAMVSPLGGVYQAGTLSGNPLAMSIGLKMLDLLRERDVYRTMEETANRLEAGFRKNADETGMKISISKIRSMMSFLFYDGPIRSFEDVQKSNTALYTEYFQRMFERGILFAPSPFEAIFISTALCEQDVEKTLRAQRLSWEEMLHE